jgi:hypothetical protein
MRVGNFSLRVLEGRERDSGHVSLEHGKTYTLRLGNHCYDRRCDAEVMVDGKSVGNFRISANGTITLERPVHDTGRFTFFKADSAQAEAAGVDKITKDERGLVSVRFRPEYPQQPVVRTISCENYTKGMASNDSALEFSPGWGARCCTSGGARGQSMSAGITGLTGQSDQRFTDVAELNYDPACETTITLRLVADQHAVRELTPATRSNPVPAAVE